MTTTAALLPEQLASLPRTDACHRATLTVVDLDHAAGIERGDLVAAVRRLQVGDLVAVGTASGGLDGVPDELLDALACTLAPIGATRAPVRAGGASVAAGRRDGGRARRAVTVADVAATVARLAERTTLFPEAVSVLTQLLPVTARCAVPRGLLVESFAYSTLLAGGEFAGWLAARPPRRRAPHGRPVVRGQRVGDVLQVTLDDPDRRNAYGAAMREGLLELLDVAEADPGVRRVLLTGAGRAFCSGGDLAEFGTGPGGATAHLIRTRRSPGAALHRLRARTEARLHGPCIGAGIELPAFAGQVSAAPGTTFMLPEIGMGLIPGAGGTVSITRRIGRWRTWFLAVDGRPLDLATAHAWGLVDGITAEPADRAAAAGP